MKFYLGLICTAIAVSVIGNSASAQLSIVGVDGSMSAGGTVSNVLEGVGSTSTVIRPGGNATTIPQRWDATQTLGITEGGFFQGTFGGTDPDTNDWAVLIGDTNPNAANALGIEVGGETGANFIEIFYSLDSDVTLDANNGGHRFSVNDNSPAETFPTSQQTLIPTTAGDHSFVIDISSLAEAGTEINFLRWDPWNVNVPLNRGTEFRINEVRFGSELVVASAIPEPTSAGLVAFGIGAMVVRRKRRVA